MSEFILKTRILNWLARRTTNSAVRRVGELPIAIGSDIGVVRSENQDRVAVLRAQRGLGHSFIVVVLCDGMGGMAEGSACACQALASFLSACIRTPNMPLIERVVSATQEANQDVHALYQGRGGATLSAVLFDSTSGMLGVNVGDSRIYAYSENKLEQLTIDDTMAGLLKDELRQRNELLQFIGMGNGLEPHIIEIPTSNESIILTSDGVHFVEKQVMQMVLQAAKDSAVAVRRLIEIAKWCGGRDNASLTAFTPFSAQLQLFDDPGIIQLWDPFGELQIIDPEATGNVGADNLACNRGRTAQEAASKSKKSTRVAKKERQTKRKVADKKDEDKVEKEPPQLNIYFNNDMGNNNHG